MDNKERFKKLEGQVINQYRVFKPILATLKDPKYHLNKLIGAGGYGGVFEVDQIKGNTVTKFAIKLVEANRNDNNQMNELEALFNLSHPNLLKAHLVGDCQFGGDEFLFVVMPLAECSLQDKINKNKLTVSEIKQMVIESAQGIQHLHSQGKIHRDFKPHNLLKENGIWKIADFGLIRDMESGDYVRSETISTTAYMPPEAFAGGVNSPGWDVWSLGISIIQAFTQEFPYSFRNPNELIKQVANGNIIIPSNLPAPFDQIVEGCLIKDRKQRWTAQQILEALNPQPARVTPNVSIPQDPRVICTIAAPKYRSEMSMSVNSDVIVIGDRAVGKTSMLLALCDLPNNRYGEKYIMISGGDCLKIKDAWVDPESGIVKPTEKAFELQTVEMSLELPSPRKIQVQLTDTRGEFWSDPKIQLTDPTVYQDYKKTISNARYVVLVLHPHKDQVINRYQEIYDPQGEIYKGDGLYSSIDWVNKLRKNLDFFSQNCKARHFFICMHKADLFCDFHDESKRWRYKPSGSNDFSGYIDRVRKRYFSIANDLIFEFNKKNGSVSKLSFFITTNKDLNLLEIPWLHLGTYLVHDAED